MSDPGVDLVPFGKYKGRPVVELMADSNYCEWLGAQSWFRERYGNVYNMIINTGGQPQDSPEHNAMQARFLDHDECLRLAHGLFQTAQEDLLELHDELTPKQRAHLKVADTFRTWVSNLSFENMGWDVVLDLNFSLPVTETERKCDCDRGGYSHGDDCPMSKVWVDNSAHISSTTPYERVRSGGDDLRRLAIELKPTMGDDYPTVLRAVTKRAPLLSGVNHWLVLADRVQFEGVTLPQVKRIFQSRGVILAMTSELFPRDEQWTCVCRECTAVR